MPGRTPYSRAIARSMIERAPQHDRAVQQAERGQRRERADVARAARDQSPRLAIERRQHRPREQAQPLAVVQGVAGLQLETGERLGEIGAAAIHPLQLLEIGIGLAMDLGSDQPLAGQAQLLRPLEPAQIGELAAQSPERAEHAQREHHGEADAEQRRAREQAGDEVVGFQPKPADQQDRAGRQAQAQPGPAG